MRRILDYGVKFVVIGDLPVQLELGAKKLEGDIDLFVIEPSVFVEEELYTEMAEKEGWGYGTTELGTPRIIARINEEEVPVEFYENIFDFDIPIEIINTAKRIRIDNVQVKAITIEDYFLLKARQGVDMDKLETYARKLRRRINIGEMKKKLELFPPEERGLITRRLSSIGINIE